jgi:lipopolysaccharide/colanic/teichoic acid biosynthesis glycosyltransferase
MDYVHSDTSVESPTGDARPLVTWAGLPAGIAWYRPGGERTAWADSVVKRLFDVMAAGVLFVALVPVLVSIALAVALDSSGPIFFRQERVGRDGKRIVILKFRTMRPDRRKRAGYPPGPERRVLHKSIKDPRITRVGRILRRTCMDELPQLWNVLRGDMSLVGPRPELPEIVARYESWQAERHRVKPGITGWWQVNRDGSRLMHEATELDLYYIEHQSLWLDLIILARTFAVVIRGCGAF